MARQPQQGQPDQLKFPPGFKTFALTEPAGMRFALEPRPGIDDQQLYWQENYLRIGKSSLRTLADVGPDIYTAETGDGILCFACYNIAAVDYAAIFTTLGKAFQVRLSDGAVTTIFGASNTFWRPGQIRPGCAQWGNQYLMIVSRATTNAYWIWDGSILYTAGTLSPVISITDGGVGYTSPPTINFFGGAGSGATAIATVENGTVTEIKFTNPGSGYQNGDVVGMAFSGGGNDTNAKLVATVTNGAITSVAIVDPGSGYAQTPTVHIGGAGSGATAVVTSISADGQITGVFLTNHGNNYTPTTAHAEIISATGGGAQLTAVAPPATNPISAIVINNGGFGYLQTPTIIIAGGNGTGAVLSAQVGPSGTVTSVVIVNGGSGYKTAPTLVVSGGNTAADAIVDLMPFGVSGNAIETYQSRVWIDQDDKLFFSAPGSTGNFSTSAGGGIVRSTEPSLKKQFTAVKQANGFLYDFGDSSIQVISNIQTSGSPVVTTFNNANTDPQIGNAWRDCVQPFGRALIFANPTGIYGLFGGTAEKLSDDVDGIFAPPSENGLAVLPPDSELTFVPSGAVCTIYRRRCYVFLLTIVDPFTGHQRPAMVGWDGKTFFMASQSKQLTFIGTQEKDSTPLAYGTDGHTFFQLFARPSILTNKILQTKLWSGDGFIINKQVLRVYWQIRDNSGAGYQVFMLLDNETPSQSQPFLVSSDGVFSWVNNLQGLFGWQNSLGGEFFWQGNNGIIAGIDEAWYGLLLGLTTRSASPDHTITGLVIGYRNYQALGF